MCYELMASVCHVRDKQAGGNLVAHVLAGERYHKRKEGVTHKTWYLFNDFAITPVEKVTYLLVSDWIVLKCQDWVVCFRCLYCPELRVSFEIAQATCVLRRGSVVGLDQ